MASHWLSLLAVWSIDPIMDWGLPNYTEFWGMLQCIMGLHNQQEFPPFIKCYWQSSCTALRVPPHVWSGHRGMKREMEGKLAFKEIITYVHPSVLAEQRQSGSKICWNQSNTSFLCPPWNLHCSPQTASALTDMANLPEALPLIASFMGPTWGPSGADRTRVGPMLAPWTLLSGDHQPTTYMWTYVVAEWECWNLSISILLLLCAWVNVP